jgi:integrase/recombinase XerD
MSPSDHRDDWLTGYPSPETRRAYLANVTEYLEWCRVADVDPLEPSRVDVNHYRDFLVGLGTLAPTTIDRKLSACRSFLAYLVEGKMAPANPFDGIARLATPGESTTPWLDADELKKLLVTARDWHLRDFVLVALMGINGLRVSETVKADARNLGITAGHRTLSVTRKGSKVGLVPLAPELAAAVDELLQGRKVGPVVPRLTRRGAIADPVAPISRNAAHKRLRKLAEWADINPAISPHSLRHSFITLSLSGGSPLHVVQLAAGHSSPATTMHYQRDGLSLNSNPSLSLAEGLLGGVR